ncbi:MAG: MFS transporter [Acidimicrobiia bacterium]|nr:MFS transporter [Acidimicrobiia bacterium]
MTTAVRRVVADSAEAEVWLRARTDVVLERQVSSADDGAGTTTTRFEAAEGPFRHYERVVEVTDGGLTSTTAFRLAVPWFGWLFTPPTKAALRHPPRPRAPWWAPPQRLDARSATVLGLLCAISLVAGYLGTLLTQTLTYAAESFGVDGDRQQGQVLASVRVGILLALLLTALADRKGRRPVLLLTAAGGCVVAATGALAPSLPWLAASQTLSRALSAALALLITIVAAEEMPRGSRAYAVSVLGMSAALGAGLCVLALPLADLDPGAWRVLYVLPLLGLPLCRSIARTLPESRRFTTAHEDVAMAGHGGRLALLAASAFLFQLFAAPASQFQNEYLRDELDFSAARISLFTVLTNTPGGIGVVVGGRLADVRGRRIVGAVGLVGGVGATVLMFLSSGAPLWAWSVVGAVIGGATVPALSVYLPELFPTSLRGRANGLIAVLGVLGSSLGLLLAGTLSDRFGGLGPAISLLAVGPAVLAVLVLTRYPETADRELEELNPEDAVAVTAGP